MKIIAVLSAVLLGVSFGAGRANAEIFNVRDLGAKGDGTTFDTAAIQKALDACAKSGGTVEFPAGNYLSKPLTLHSARRSNWMGVRRCARARTRRIT